MYMNQYGLKPDTYIAFGVYLLMPKGQRFLSIKCLISTPSASISLSQCVARNSQREKVTPKPSRRTWITGSILKADNKAPPEICSTSRKEDPGAFLLL